jgi:hypothetical protein
MKHHRLFLALTALVLASLACQALQRDGNAAPAGSEPTTNQSDQPTAAAAPTTNNNTTVKTDFVMTSDAFNITDMGDGSILFFSKMSLDDLMKFYREEYSGRDYIEREGSTSISDTTFSMVFDGDPSGKALVIQSVDLGDGSRTVAIRLEDV